MNEPMVTVIQEQKIMAWPDEPGAKPRAKDRAYVLPLSKAIARAYSTDAHFAQYISPNGRRLRSEAVSHGVSARIDVLVLDVDCKEVHGTSEPVPAEWRVDLRMKMLALRAAHAGLLYYETKGGARIVYRQPVPVVIASKEDASQWKQDYATTVAYLRRTFGIEADPACADWTRLFRLPHATRKPGGAPEDWPVAGDPCNVEALWFTPSDEDVEEAKTILPRAFEEKIVKSFTPCNSDGFGVLYYALRNRGHLIRAFKQNTFLIRCPNESSHSSGRTGDSSTVLYLPGPGDTLGYIHCLHAHCQALAAKDWLRMFTDSEINAAREAAGLTGRKTA